MPFQPPVSRKQALISSETKRFTLVEGPRFSSKTVGCLHSIPWHLWNTQSVPGMMLGRTTTQNSDGGPWQLLIEQVLPVWEDGDFGFEVVTPVRMEAVTHKFYFETTNKFDSVSRFYLESLDVEAEAEKKFKGKNYSLIYIPELSHYKSRKTFDVLQECLRPSINTPDQFHRMICDTNPADEGEDSWIWRLWFWFRTVDLDNLDTETKEELNLNNVPPDKYATTIRALKRLQENLAVHSYTIDDNIFITQDQKDEQFAKYAHDKDLLDRYYYGKWVKASGDGLFKEVWRPNIHAIGEKPMPGTEPEFMIPEQECIELGGGWDISSRRNAAVALIEPVSVECEQRDQKTGEKQIILQPGFKIMDEYVSLGRQQVISSIADDIFEKVQFWNGLCKLPPRWEHWSDNSSFDISGQTETSEAQDIFRLTGGLVELRSITSLKQMAIKGHSGVEKRIDLIQRLLFEGRIWVNANKCPNIMEMFSAIKRNAKGKLSTTSVFKHAFDAISYYIAVKCWLEMKKQPRIMTNREAEEARVIVTSL
jgi:hypothetical protein